MGDPSELENVLHSNNDTARELDGLLRGVVDYDAVDKEVKMEEKMLYDRYYYNVYGTFQLYKQWRDVYTGFHNDDRAKVQEWYNSTESSPQPPEPLLVV